MTKTLLAVAVTLLVGFAAGTAVAGDYHTGNTLVCADCHTMHYSRSHDLAGGNDPSWTEMGPGGPFHYLLRAEGSELCLMCHDGSSDAPDVYGAHGNGYDRSGGALNDSGGPDGYQPWTGHTLGSTDVAPGGTWTAEHGLECVSCHHQHGRAAGTDAAGNSVTSTYRNLKPFSLGGATKGVSYSIGEPKDLTKDVWEAHGAGSSLTDHYSQNNIGLLEPVSSASGIANFCKSCHTNFHGDKGGAELGGDPATGHDWLRHPTADINIGQQSSHGHTSLTRYTDRAYRVRVMSASGNWGPVGSAWTTPPTDITPTCLSCHKGHGNMNAFGLVCATGSAPIGEDGDSTDARVLCKQCHVQGGA